MLAWFGGGWVIVWIPSHADNLFSAEANLLHELGHEFGAAHSDNPNSVMCSASPGYSCNLMTLAFDKRSLISIRGGIKIIKRIGLDTYAGLRARGY